MKPTKKSADALREYVRARGRASTKRVQDGLTSAHGEQVARLNAKKAVAVAEDLALTVIRDAGGAGIGVNEVVRQLGKHVGSNKAVLSACMNLRERGKIIADYAPGVGTFFRAGK